jgi:hypothetical protein
VSAGLNKGEARNTLAGAVFFNRLGEIRDRNFDQQRYSRGHGHTVNESLLQYLSPLGWEHINLIGDYPWRGNTKVGAGKFRLLRRLQLA